MSGEHEPHAPETMGAGRLEAFSDAVMAVIITLLAFELQPPTGSTWASLTDVKGDFFIYVLAFAFIAIYWNNHHHLLRATTRIDGAVMWANMLLLLCLSLIPVLTRWLKAFPLDAQPVATFGIVALASGLSYLLLVHALIRANGPDSLLARAISSDVKGYASLGLYAAAVVLAFVSVWISYALYAAVAVMWLIPDRRFSRAARED
jgi:uncharacterized membrane protein